MRWYFVQIIKAYVLSIGTCATVPCEPCQIRKEAALSNVYGVPQASLIGALLILSAQSISVLIVEL